MKLDEVRLCSFDIESCTLCYFEILGSCRHPDLPADAVKTTPDWGFRHDCPLPHPEDVTIKKKLGMVEAMALAKDATDKAKRERLECVEKQAEIDRKWDTTDED
jgi:hypothetical protein